MAPTLFPDFHLEKYRKEHQPVLEEIAHSAVKVILYQHRPEAKNHHTEFQRYIQPQQTLASNPADDYDGYTICCGARILGFAALQDGWDDTGMEQGSPRIEFAFLDSCCIEYSYVQLVLKRQLDRFVK